MPTSCPTPRNTVRRRHFGLVGGLALLVGVVCSASGCGFLKPLLFMSQHKEKVPAEFDKLEGKRVAFVVWADQETLFDYPHVRMELGLYIGDKVWSKVKKVDVVDGRRIEDHIQKLLSDSIDPEKIGRAFDCDMVVYVELLEFQIRDPEAPDFLRARIRGSVTVYNLKADPDESKRYELENETAVYPENQPVLFTNANALNVRKAAYELFAEQVARKFYAYEQEM
jgi:hypothetical protein